MRQALVEILGRGRTRDPVLDDASITVSEVRISPDLKQATVFASRLGDAENASVIDALNRAAPRLRGLLGKMLEMKYTPALRFRADTTFYEIRKIESLLSRPEVVRDLDRP